MGDSDQRPSPAPESHHNDAAAVEPQPQAQPEAQLDVARRFLHDDEIRSAPRDKKVEFLKSKGIDEADIAVLLQETETESVSDNAVETPGSSEISLPTSPTPAEKTDILPTTTGDRPPIVTYPEFLAKPARPPPLVTTNRLLHTLNGLAVLSTALYGASRFVVGPMVDRLTAARAELHAATADKLDGIVAKLEQTVSVLPPPRAQPVALDVLAFDDAEDPAEMFHRDVGTQTSVPPSPSPADAAASPADAAQQQTESLASLVRSLSVLRDDYRTQSESFEDVKSLVDVFRDDLDAMTYGSTTDFVGGYDMYSMRRKTEPEDEIKKVRDNIRRVKGVLLSTRNFPTSTRRQ
jgi:hypothetical protein